MTNSSPLGHYYGPTIQAATVHEDAEMGETLKRLAIVWEDRYFRNITIKYYESHLR